MMKEILLKGVNGTLKMADNVVGAMADCVLTYVTVADYGVQKVREFCENITEDIDYEIECLQEGR